MAKPSTLPTDIEHQRQTWSPPVLNQVPITTTAADFGASGDGLIAGGS